MKKIDYMNDPLDFCLYPDEIVQKFTGREVFAYGTGYECYGFFQLFAQHLKIKQVVNHFDSSDLLTQGGGKKIADLDALLSIRKDEPIFVLSRPFWVEIVDYLESKGLVLGTDVFFWEQGWSRDDIIDRFIKHNKSIWKSEVRKSKNKIVIPSQNHWYTIDCVCLAYCANYLANLHDAEINMYLRLGRERDYMYTNKTGREIYCSFNTNGIFSFECMPQQFVRAQQLFNQIWGSINTWRELYNLTINDINFGRSIIGSFLRYSIPSLKLKTSLFANHLFEKCQYIVTLLDYFNEHNDVKAVVLWDMFGQEGFLRDIAVTNGVPVYAVHYVWGAVKCSLHYPHKDYFRNYKNFFYQLSEHEKEVGLEWARLSVEARLNGDKKEITYMQTSIYQMKEGERVLEQNDKLKVLICPHTLEDDLYPNGWQTFSCFVEWMDHLGQLSNQTNYDWYLKMHPVSSNRDQAFIKEFLQTYPRIKQVPTWTSPKQLKKEGIKCAFTIYGTLGHEYPALGIQVVNAGNNPHIAFNFCHNPKTPEEFDRIVFNLPNLVDRPIDINELYQFYCIHFLYYKSLIHPIKDVFFRRPESYKQPWDPVKGDRPATELINDFQRYLEDWTPDFHEVTKRKTVELFREMDSYRDDVFYKNDPDVIEKKLAAVGLSLR